MVKYNCLICETTPDKKSHHANHKRTKKHKLQKENLTLKLQQKSEEELLLEYQETDVELIISKLENNIVESDESDDIDESSGLDLNDLIDEDFESIHKTSNKDALKDKIHEIHNFLRNNGAGYGMSALKVFNVLYGLKRIEEYDLFKTINLDEKYKFSKLLQMSKNPINYNNLQIRIHQEYLGGLFGNNKLKKFLFYEIPENINGKTYARIIEYIEELTKIEDQTNTNLSGKVYEYFVGRDESAISELGAYFTNRLLTNYIYNELCPPELNDDGSVPTMIDMYGGSGGFTLGYINYINENFNIDWKENVNSIYHFDVNEDVVKSAALEILCATHQIPNMGDNVHYRNAFTSNFYDKKYHYIYTNPPYGGDKVSKTDTQLKNEKILKFIKEKLNIKNKRDIDIMKCQSDPEYKNMVKQYLNLEKFEKDFKENIKMNNVNFDTCGKRAQLYCNKHSLSEKCKDKESMSLIIMMMLLEENGTAIGVLKEGVFFDSKYKILRKHLIQNFNVTHVVSIPQDQFENTSTKTSIIVFKNTEKKTTNIKFSELEVEKYLEDIYEINNGIITLKEAKDEIKGIIDNFIINASINEIDQQDYNLNSKKYNRIEIIPGDGFKIQKLDKLCKINYGNRITKENNLVENGIYPVYGGGDISFYTNIKNRDKGTLIVSRFAVSKNCVRLIETDFYLNDGGLSLETKNINQKYLNYIIITYKKIIYNLTGGSIQKGLDIELFKELQIPIPIVPEQIQYWVDTISEPYNLKIENQNRVNTLEQEIEERINHIIEYDDCENVELGKLSESIKSGNHSIKKNEFIPGRYRIIGGGIKPIGTHNEYNCDENDIICASHGTVGKLHMYNEKTFLTMSISIKIKNPTLNKYIYKFLKLNNNIIKNFGNGSTIKCLTKTQLEKIKIPIPKNKKLITDLEPKFQELEQYLENVQMFNRQYEQKLNDLYQASVNEIR